jgi:hypothetical protein
MRYTFDMHTLFSWLNLSKLTKTPPSRYEELCAIKDSLYRDIARLEHLQGSAVAGQTVSAICAQLLGVNFGK